MDLENDEDPFNFSIQALSARTKKYISALLNPIKVIPTDKGLPRDWQGLAELIGIGGEQIPQLQSNCDPTFQVLKIWYEIDARGSTIRKLLNYLEELDRFDIIGDTKDYITEDLGNFKDKLINGVNNINLIPEDNDILTVDDIVRFKQGLGPQNYDAFVLFADDDIDFATELIDTMEKQYHLKLCVKERDMVGGTIELETIIKLITERCNRLIVIVSPAFLLSPWNKFFVSFAQRLGIEQRQRKIIPCLYSECEVPPELRCYFMLNYKRSGKLWHFWSRLRDSVRTPQDSHTKLERSRSQNGLLRQAEPHDAKSKKECVKFKSNENIKQETIDDVLPEVELNEGPSSNNLPVFDVTSKKSKARSSWLKKLLPHKTSRSRSDVSDKDKKKFWNRHYKQKVAV